MVPNTTILSKNEIVAAKNKMLRGNYGETCLTLGLERCVEDYNPQLCVANKSSALLCTTKMELGLIVVKMLPC